MNPQQRLEQFMDLHGLHDRDHALKKLENPKFCREFQKLIEDCIGVKEEEFQTLADDLEVEQ